MVRKSRVRVEGYDWEGDQPLPGAVFPSGRVTVYRKDLLMFYHNEGRIPLERGSLLPTSRRPRTGVGYRREDESGVSGTGVVFDFAEFPGGWVVQEWRNEENGNIDGDDPRDSGMDFRPSMRIALQIHGHGGRTEYIYDNGEVAGL